MDDLLEYFKKFPLIDNDPYYQSYLIGSNKWGFKLEATHTIACYPVLEDSYCIYYNDTLCLSSPTIEEVKSLIKLLGIKCTENCQK